METDSLAAVYAEPFGQVMDLNNPKLYINRDIGRLRFILQVLEEATGERHPLLERAKFLAIVGENLDEFFMIRVARLYRRLHRGKLKAPSAIMTRKELLQIIREELLSGLHRQYCCWRDDVLPKLRQAGIDVLDHREVGLRQVEWLRRRFQLEFLPDLAPVLLGEELPFPHLVNLHLYLAVVIADPAVGSRLALVGVPDAFPRLLSIPREEEAAESAETASTTFVWLEQVVAANLDVVFADAQVVSAHPFRITRDADREIKKDGSDDLLAATEEMLGQREIGRPVRLELDRTMPVLVRDLLMAHLGLEEHQVYASDGPVGMRDLWELLRVDRPDLKDAPFEPVVPPLLATAESIFAAVRRHDILLYHPYDSFAPVVEFFRQAARDPDVLEIYQSLYRVDRNSPVMAAMMEAASNGKRVTVMAELKARFDERNNVGWARRLKAAGVEVIYGLAGLKTHAKASLVTRREDGDIIHYTHVGTGNYHNVTTRIYADLGYFTSDPDIGADVHHLFRVLAGHPDNGEYRKLLVAPWTMRQQILKRIEREIERQRVCGDGCLILKMNALLDEPCIKALYRASQAGVNVVLQIRGMCGLRPGIPGLSDNITVTSIVGRFLEHTRIYYFRNGGDEEILLGSADLRPRNLSRRVETLFSVQDPTIRDALRDRILDVHLRDNMQARWVLSDGGYEWVRPRDGETRLNSQAWLVKHRGMWHSGQLVRS